MQFSMQRHHTLLSLAQQLAVRIQKVHKGSYRQLLRELKRLTKDRTLVDSFGSALLLGDGDVGPFLCGFHECINLISLYFLLLLVAALACTPAFTSANDSTMVQSFVGALATFVWRFQHHTMTEVK